MTNLKWFQTRMNLFRKRNIIKWIWRCSQMQICIFINKFCYFQANWNKMHYLNHQFRFRLELLEYFSFFNHISVSKIPFSNNSYRIFDKNKWKRLHCDDIGFPLIQEKSDYIFHSPFLYLGKQNWANFDHVTHISLFKRVFMSSF